MGGQGAEMHTTLGLPEIASPSPHASTGFAGVNAVLVFTPRQLHDAGAVIRAVRENNTVVVNSSWLEDASGQRLIDFVCGGLDAIGGHVHRIAEEVFLFSPAHACVTDAAST
jgi:cell division inhibitor SepF